MTWHHFSILSRKSSFSTTRCTADPRFLNKCRGSPPFSRPTNFEKRELKKQWKSCSFYWPNIFEKCSKNVKFVSLPAVFSTLRNASDSPPFSRPINFEKRELKSNGIPVASIGQKVLKKLQKC